MKVIIVGGVAGGASCAARLRRLDEKAEIVIIERSGYVSYANCGLPYYIGGVIKDRSNLTLQTPLSFFRRFNIDVRVNHEVIKIVENEKKVIIKNLITNEVFDEYYDKLVLSPGAKPIIPSIKGIDNFKVFTLRTAEDTFKIYDFINKHNPKKAVVIGAGFIGLEMAENLINKNIEVDIVQKGNYIMPVIDEDMSNILSNYLTKNGIRIHLNFDTCSIEPKNEKLIVKSTDDLKVTTDFVILAVGVMPESKLALDINAKLGIKNAICVNNKMQISDDIYAVGDAVMIKHMLTNADAVISLAGPANKEGRVAANNICNINDEYKGSLGSSIMKMFDLTVASTGYNSIQCLQNKFDFDYVILQASSHANYYPNAKSMYIKVLFEKNNGKILGAQIIGFEGVDKKIDVLATAIKFKATAYDLKDLDLAYAPPYSQAKDPINIVGYMIENLLNGLVKQIHWEDLLNHKDAYILDVRTVLEYNKSHFKDAHNIEVNDLRNNLNSILKDKEILVYCHSGLRSYIACKILQANGYNCYNISGGYSFYENTILKNCLSEKGKKPCGL